MSRERSLHAFPGRLRCILLLPPPRRARVISAPRLLSGHVQGASMPPPRQCFRLTLFLILLLASPGLWRKGLLIKRTIRCRSTFILRVLHLRRRGRHSGGDRLDRSGVRVQLGRHSQGATSRHSPGEWLPPSNNSRLSSRRNRSRAFGLQTWNWA